MTLAIYQNCGYCRYWQPTLANRGFCGEAYGGQRYNLSRHDSCINWAGALAIGCHFTPHNRTVPKKHQLVTTEKISKKQKVTREIIKKEK